MLDGVLYEMPEIPEPEEGCGELEPYPEESGDTDGPGRVTVRRIGEQSGGNRSPGSRLQSGVDVVAGISPAFPGYFVGVSLVMETFTTSMSSHVPAGQAGI